MRRKNLKRQAENTYAELIISDKSTSKYNHSRCFTELNSADDILDRVRLDRSLVFKNMRKFTPVEELDPFDEIFSVDEKCLCQGGWGARPYVNKQFCAGCEMMRRISKGIKIPEDSILTIESGCYVGNSYSIVSCENIFIPYIRTKEYENLSNVLIDKITKMNLYDPIFKEINERTFYYSTISPITNYIAISIVLQNKMHKYKIPTTPLFEWSYQCGKNTYILETYPNMGFGTFHNILESQDYSKGPRSPTARKSNAMSISSNTIVFILKQLVSTLHFLAKYSFVHGNPNIRHLAFTKKTCYYKYDGVEISAPLTLHLIPSNDSSITLENDNGEYYRLLNSGYVKNIKEYPNVIEKYEPFVGDKIYSSGSIPSIIPVMEELEQNLIYGYKIGACKDIFQDLITQKGIPLMHTSFDIYMFMFSLLTEECFFASFSEHNGLMDIWKNMFKFSEYDDVMEDLKVLRNKESEESITFEEILTVFSKYTFRSDALKYLWESIKTVE